MKREAAALLLGLASCSVKPQDRYMQRPVSATELVGAWRSSAPGNSPQQVLELVLRSNSNCRLVTPSTLPDEAGPHGTLPGMMATPHCSWTLATLPYVPPIDKMPLDAIHVPAVWVTVAYGNSQQVWAFYVAEEDRTLILWEKGRDPYYRDAHVFYRSPTILGEEMPQNKGADASASDGESQFNPVLSAATVRFVS